MEYFEYERDSAIDFSVADESEKLCCNAMERQVGVQRARKRHSGHAFILKVTTNLRGAAGWVLHLATVEVKRSAAESTVTGVCGGTLKCTGNFL